MTFHSHDEAPNSRFSQILSRVLAKLRVDDIPHIKRIIVTIIGGTVLILSVALLVTPFPAVLVAPVGLAILGTEYAWARRWLRQAREMPAKTMVKTHRVRRRFVINYAKFRRRRAAAREL